MGRAEKCEGWRVSEVEALLGLGRRDIQRCCYAGRGGIGLLEPADTAWGRRTYGRRELAQLFLVRQYRRAGLSLPEVKERWDQAAAAGKTVEGLLAVQVARLRDQADEVLGQLLQAQALLAALTGAEPEEQEALIACHGQARLALEPAGTGPVHAEAPGAAPQEHAEVPGAVPQRQARSAGTAPQAHVDVGASDSSAQPDAAGAASPACPDADNADPPVCPDAAGTSPQAPLGPCQRWAELVDSPGMALALELWQGPGAAARWREAAGADRTRNE